MKFSLTINCDNVAFTDYPEEEIARILRLIAEKMDIGGAAYAEGVCLDLNGNRVGTYKLTGRSIAKK